MKKLFERGQGVLVLVLLGAIVAAVMYFGLIVNAPGMQAGADTIGDAVGDAIDNTSRPGIEDLVWQGQNAISFWVNQQKLTPNKHSIERHGADAWAATNCYNNNGTFQIWRLGNTEFHMLCKETDGVTIFDIVLRRWTNNSREFDFRTCFRKEKGLADAIRWLRNKGAMENVKLPNDIIIYIDGVAP
jgi:hypothetical protein